MEKGQKPVLLESSACRPAGAEVGTVSLRPDFDGSGFKGERCLNSMHPGIITEALRDRMEIGTAPCIRVLNACRVLAGCRVWPSRRISPMNRVCFWDCTAGTGGSRSPRHQLRGGCPGAYGSHQCASDCETDYRPDSRRTLSSAPGGLLEFCQSEVGKRVIVKMPALIADSQKAGAEWGQRIAEKLTEEEIQAREVFAFLRGPIPP